MALPNDTEVPSYDKRFNLLQSVRKKTTFATYEQAFKDKNARDNIVRPHKFQEEQWVLVRHDNAQKSESERFGHYQMVEKMLLGTYGLHYPNKRELAALVHGNRLIEATVSTADKLKEM